MVLPYPDKIPQELTCTRCNFKTTYMVDGAIAIKGKGVLHFVARGEGWRIEKEDGEWVKLCPKCYESDMVNDLLSVLKEYDYTHSKHPFTNAHNIVSKTIFELEEIKRRDNLN